MPAVRKIRPEELSQTFELIDGEGWDVPWEKYSLMHKAYPDCFFLIETDNGELAGTVSFVEILPGVFELGYYVVRKDLRGQGFGRKLFDGATRTLNYKSLSVYAGPGAGPVYKALGYKESGDKSDMRWDSIDIDSDTVTRKLSSMNAELGDIEVNLYTAENFQELVDYDNENRLSDNAWYMKVLVQFAEVLVARSKSTGKMTGYYATYLYKSGMMGMEGLYADSDTIALVLFRDALIRHPHVKTVRLRTLEVQPFLRDLGETYDLFTCPRWSQGEYVPPTPLTKLYGITDCDYQH